jgi:rod shape-determining protein MreD
MGHRSINAFRLVTVLALALTFVFLEAALSWPRRWLGAQIDLLPALMVFTALRLGIGSILALAFIGGLAFDALSLNPLGVSPLPLCVIGMVLNARRDEILREEVFAQTLLGLAAGVVFPLGTLLMILTTGEAPLLGPGLIWDLLVLGAGGAVAAPLIFKLINTLEHALTYQAHDQPTFRSDREIQRGRN